MNNRRFTKREKHLKIYGNGRYSSQINFLLIKCCDIQDIVDCKLIPVEAVVPQHSHRILVIDIRSIGKKMNTGARYPKIKLWYLKTDKLGEYREETKNTMSAAPSRLGRSIEMEGNK